MRRYTHLTARERETIMWLARSGETVTAIAVEIGRDKSTVSRELARNSSEGGYSALAASEKYTERRSQCGRRRILDDPQDLIANDRMRFTGERSMTPSELVDELSGAERLIFKTMYSGNAARKAYRMYEYELANHT